METTSKKAVAHHLHVWRQHSKPDWSGHVVCSVCGWATGKEMVLRASDVADSQLSAELVAERRALLALPVDFPLCEFYTLSDALRTWAVEYGRIESGEISHSEACNVVERAYAGGWHKFRVDWEKARRVGSYARERLQAVGSVDDGEEKRFYHELDVSGLYRECTADAMRGGGLYRARSGSGGGRWRGCGGALRLG